MEVRTKNISARETRIRKDITFPYKHGGIKFKISQRKFHPIWLSYMEKNAEVSYWTQNSVKLYSLVKCILAVYKSIMSVYYLKKYTTVL